MREQLFLVCVTLLVCSFGVEGARGQTVGAEIWAVDTEDDVLALDTISDLTGDGVPDVVAGTPTARCGPFRV